MQVIDKHPVFGFEGDNGCEAFGEFHVGVETWFPIGFFPGFNAETRFVKFDGVGDKDALGGDGRYE